MAWFLRFSSADRKTRASELLERFDRVEAADRVAKGYSGGMRRRLDIGMWKVIEELGVNGTTVVLTTQYLEEADQLADPIVVIDRGVNFAEVALPTRRHDRR